MSVLANKIIPPPSAVLTDGVVTLPRIISLSSTTRSTWLITVVVPLIVRLEFITTFSANVNDPSLAIINPVPVEFASNDIVLFAVSLNNLNCSTVVLSTKNSIELSLFVPDVESLINFILAPPPPVTPVLPINIVESTVLPPSFAKI